jgi:ABC-2 type transport system ATP-binding protein
MIEIKNLIKQYDSDFTLEIPDLVSSKGEMIGLAGNNGAGKTTLLNLILDLIPATSGHVYSKGKDVAHSEHWKPYTGSYLDEGFLIGFLTPLEYLNFTGSLYGYSKTDVDDFILKYSDFLENEIIHSGKLIRTLSTGNKSKLGILAAIMGAGEVLILDEPFAHLDPSSQFKLKRILKQLAEEKNLTMIISSHDLKHLADLCSRIIILSDGKIKKDMLASTETLKELEAFFGV